MWLQPWVWRCVARLPEASWEWLRARYMAKYLLYSSQIQSCRASALNRYSYTQRNVLPTWRFMCALFLHNHNQSWTEQEQNKTRAHVKQMQIPSRLQTCLAMADTSHTISGIHAKSVVTAKHVVATRHSQNCGHKRGAYQQQFTKLCTKCRPNTPQKVPTLSLYRCLHEPQWTTRISLK